MKKSSLLGKIVSTLCLGAMTGSLSQASAQTFPTVNASNFPSGSYTGPNYTVQYRYFKPVAYNPADSNTKYPMVLFLHGQGEKSPADNTQQLNSNANGSMIFIATNVPPSNANYQTQYPCFYVAPQCSAGGWEDEAAELQGIVNYFISNFNVDPNRVYITGLSMGGAGVGDQLSKYPNTYAAANPNTGWSVGNETAYRNVPLWAFWCTDDVGFGWDGGVSNLRIAGGTPIYTRYASGGHSGSWTRAYDASTPLVPWMFSQRKGQALSKAFGPSVTVSTPAGAVSGALTTSANAITFTGTSGDSAAAVTSLYWENFSTWTGSDFAQGPVSGTTSWTSGSIPLNGGRQNPIQLFGQGIAYASPGNGSTTFSAFVNVTQAASTDTVAPTVNITAPTTGTAYTSPSSTLNLAGNASDNVALSSVTWSNSRGGSGTAAGTSSWTVSNIALLSGSNVLTVTATDTSGLSSSKTLTVSYSGAPVNQAPVVNAGSNQTITLPSTATLNGTVTDDGLPTGATVTTTWTTLSGPGTVTFANAAAKVTTATFPTAGTYVLKLTASDTAATSNATTTVTVNPVSAPVGFTALDIGSPGAAGSIVLNSGTYTVQAAGADIWGTTDSFHYDYQTLNGDGMIIAKVASFSSGNSWAKAGVMIRSSLSANASNAFMCVSPSSGQAFFYRNGNGATTDGQVWSGAAPIWLKLVRLGNLFTGYTSADGITWSQVSSSTFTMPSQVYIGLATTSHISGTLATASYSNVSIASATAYTPVDIGSPGAAGSVSLSNGIYTVQGAGADIWGTSDSFHYDYQTLTGDGTIIAKVASLTNTNGWAKAGVMIRSSLAVDAANAFMCVSPTSGQAFFFRSGNGASTDGQVWSGNAPVWLKLVRSGSTFSGYTSSDGVAWSLVSSSTITMPSQVYIGLAVTSHVAGTLTTATFSNVLRQ